MKFNQSRVIDSDTECLIDCSNQSVEDGFFVGNQLKTDERLDVKPVSLSFHDVRYEVKQKVDDVPLCGKVASKEILSGISGILPPGLNAIMGPTGSGKTSLLDVLAQRKDPRGLKNGVVLLNGERPPADFRLMSGYVVQNDTVMGTLTVKENIAFSANLRLPRKKYSSQMMKEKVENVIDELGLQSCAETMVGNEFVRGISGGERKRVNIGMEMILDPPILFLDEPSTGLDANTAKSIILLLYKLASGGRNIIVSIHQPRYSIFTLFNRLIILHKGKMVYRGLANQAVEYFKNIGFACPTFHNPADFFLDIVCSDVNTAPLIKRMNEASLTSTHYGEASGDIEEAVSTNQITNGDNAEFLFEQFEKSSRIQEENKKLEELLNRYRSNNDSALGALQVTNTIGCTQYANGFLHQLQAVLNRTTLNIIRNPMTVFVQVFVMLVFGALIGLIYYQIDTSFKSGIQNRAGCFYFLITIQVMSNLSALEVFIKNRAHFIHESASGYYRVSIYFIAQVFADLIPNRLLPNLVFSTIIYFMIGLQPDPIKFSVFVLSLVLTAVCACSIAFLVSSIVNVFAVANIVVALPYILMMLFSGFLVNIGSLLNWLKWIKYISIFRYGMNALIVNELKGMVFIDNSSYPGFNSSSNQPCTSKLWKSLAQFMGSKLIFTTSYNPKANGLVERYHRVIKSALKAQTNPSDWYSHLGWILLGLHATMSEENQYCPAELLYGSPIRLPGEFFDKSENIATDEYILSLRQFMKSISAVSVRPISNQKTFVDKALHECHYVFIREDGHKTPLQRPYRGPFKVLERNDKYFTFQLNSSIDSVSIDRLKPAKLPFLDI